MVEPGTTTEWLKSLGDKYSQIRLGPGVVGKTSRVALAVLALWGLIVFRMTPDYWFDGFLFAGGLLGTGLFLWWVRKTHEFAERHPDAALLEGAELIEYQRFEAEINGKSIARSLSVPNPVTTIPITDSNKKN